MQRMSWLLSQHVLVYRVDSHTSHVQESVGLNGEIHGKCRCCKLRVTNALSYSANDLDDKLEELLVTDLQTQ